MCAKTFSRTHSQQADVSHEDQTDVEPQYTKEIRGDFFKINVIDWYHFTPLDKFILEKLLRSG